MIPNNDSTLCATFNDGDSDGRWCSPVIAWDNDGNAWCLGERRLVRAIDYLEFVSIGELLPEAGDYEWHVEEDQPKKPTPREVAIAVGVAREQREVKYEYTEAPATA